MLASQLLYCPIRGQLNVKARTKGGLCYTEEKRRIDCIRYLLKKGYPKGHLQTETTILRFGHKGQNSFRTDIVAYDLPRSVVDLIPLDTRLEHVLLVTEVKRDNEDAEEAKATQVEPAVRLLPDSKAMGLYWDDLEQKVFYKTQAGSIVQVHEAPLKYLPDYGTDLELDKLHYEDLEKSPNLAQVFRRLDDALHPHCSDKPLRYELLLQILLVKIYDEEAHRALNGAMLVQDFPLFQVSDEDVKTTFNEALGSALTRYQPYLPRKLSPGIDLPGSALRQVSRHLAPVNLLESNPEVIQDFYMFFAKELYKWDLAQYFTPYEVVDFIVRITNPQFGDAIKDPACGSADFLVSAHRRGKRADPKIGDRIWGADNSSQAVQISVLNMLLNGDGKSNIRDEDSLVEVERDVDKFTIVLCNPPFGIRIKERRKSVLARFDLGKNKFREETGILFAELCVRQARAGGRVAIILPNGYLGNRSQKYRDLRTWLLQRTKLVAIIAFPRFTFKKSGADVSASVLVMEKRTAPLGSPTDTEDYPVYVGMLESVGWQIGNKRAEKVWKRRPEDGSLDLSPDNEPRLDADFDEVLSDLYASPVADAFPWIVRDLEVPDLSGGWAVSVRDIVDADGCLMDPKRLCRKYREITAAICEGEHTGLLDICDVIQEGGFTRKASEVYRYVELQGVHESTYEFSQLRGWQLPSRAKHRAAPGDIFVGSIWGSVGKWFVAGKEAEDDHLIVTNGCYRLRVKEGMEGWLADLAFALSSEFYRVQMRALATGSDGLAEVSEADLAAVSIPRLSDSAVRVQIARYLDARLEACASARMLVDQSVGFCFPTLAIAERKSPFTQV